jgi:hypothetical protein
MEDARSPYLSENYAPYIRAVFSRSTEFFHVDASCVCNIQFKAFFISFGVLAYEMGRYLYMLRLHLVLKEKVAVCPRPSSSICRQGLRGTTISASRCSQPLARKQLITFRILNKIAKIWVADFRIRRTNGLFPLPTSFT